mmetsp:Transcript_73611/g.127712  ORF Transcript_73611/g.127712 Transcript_73611/m.127712 type:complete len:226 (+) Transcript_73611:1958-2635(+)
MPAGVNRSISGCPLIAIMSACRCNTATKHGPFARTVPARTTGTPRRLNEPTMVPLPRTARGSGGGGGGGGSSGVGGFLMGNRRFLPFSTGGGTKISSLGGVGGGVGGRGGGSGLPSPSQEPSASTSTAAFSKTAAAWTQLPAQPSGTSASTWPLRIINAQSPGTPLLSTIWPSRKYLSSMPSGNGPDCFMPSESSITKKSWPGSFMYSKGASPAMLQESNCLDAG